MKKSYRKLAMKYYPDRNPNDKKAEKKFKEIREAYDVLRDEQKRAAYDRFGHDAFAASAAGGGHYGFETDGGGGFWTCLTNLWVAGRQQKPAYVAQMYAII